MRFELWQSSDENGTETMLLGTSDEYERSRAMLAHEPNMKLTWVVEAENHDEAMQLHYDHLGWGDHLAFDELPGAQIEIQGVVPGESGDQS
jgi:hypothetical protein